MELKSRKVYIVAVGYSLIIGLSFLFVKIALESSDPINLLAYRFTAAFIGVLIGFVFNKNKVRYDKKSIRRILPLALLYPLSFFTFQTFGLQYTTSAEAGIIFAMAPIFTVILASYFLKEKTNLLQKLSILLSVIGVIYITVSQNLNLNFQDSRGIILMILASLAFSGYSVLARKLTKDFTNIELSNIMITISFIVFSLLSLGRHILNGTISDIFTPLSNPSFIIAVLYLGVLSTFATALMTNYILSKIEASKMSVFSNLSIVITIIAGAVFLNEKLYHYHIIGSILIIGGVLGVNFLNKKDPEPENDAE